jgi:hypothetical protein
MGDACVARPSRRVRRVPDNGRARAREGARSEAAERRDLLLDRHGRRQPREPFLSRSAGIAEAAVCDGTVAANGTEAANAIARPSVVTAPPSFMCSSNAEARRSTYTRRLTCSVLDIERTRAAAWSICRTEIRNSSDSRAPLRSSTYPTRGFRRSCSPRRSGQKGARGALSWV